jgi:hypothetical protein
MRTKNPDPALIVETADGMFDLTTADGSITSMMDLLRRGQSEAKGYDEVARRVSAAADEIDPEDVLSNLTVPFMPEEVWAAGVTYEISEQAREEESAMPDIYMDVTNRTGLRYFSKRHRLGRSDRVSQLVSGPIRSGMSLSPSWVWCYTMGK